MSQKRKEKALGRVLITKLEGKSKVSDFETFLVCLQDLVSFFQCATKVGHNQVLTRGHELGV